MHLAFFIFFYFLTFLSHLVFVFTSDFPIISTFTKFLKPQPIRAMTVKCDGSVYHIDVDVDMGWSAVCDFGISWSHSLYLLLCLTYEPGDVEISFVACD